MIFFSFSCRMLMVLSIPAKTNGSQLKVMPYAVVADKNMLIFFSFFSLSYNCACCSSLATGVHLGKATRAWYESVSAYAKDFVQHGHH